MHNRAIRSVTRALQVRSTRVAAPYIRTYTTNPDSTKPTSDSPENASTAKPQGGSSTFWLLVAITAGGAGGWYYLQQESNDPHAQVKEEEERMKRKAQELKEAGKATAHDAVREGQQGYENFKASGKEKLDQARLQAASAAQGAQSKLSQTFDDTTHKVEQTYTDVKDAAIHKYQDAAHRVDETKESWSQWFGSWFGYGKSKAGEVKREGAESIANVAAQVENEAKKRT